MTIAQRLPGGLWLALFAIIAAAPTNAQAPATTAAVDAAYFSQWPTGADPRTVGLALAKHFVAAPHQYTKTLHYSETVSWYGAIEIALLTGDKPLLADLDKRFQPMLGEDAARIPESGHVDNSVFGALPLELFLAEGDPKYLSLGKGFADRQWAKPDAQGLSGETRFWIDDMYMITLLQVQAFRATKDPVYLQRSAREMSAYLDKLQQPNGLFYHAPDVPFFWGRGDGWMAAGMSELLRSLPANDPQRPRILEGYRKMMTALVKYQGKDGAWRQLIDDDAAWPESSSTGMFTFALISGVRNGWLDAATFGPAARRGWLALTGYIDQNSDVVQVCEGTNKMASLDYYLQRKRRTGDFHGQAPVMWAAAAMLR
jgi:unsaturated rhamnogalacturonyl hydrolase